jgi:hypothetical protein
MRRAVTPAIPVSMYRHFAVVTLVITAGLAMFADGENREARAAQVAKPAPPSPAVLATATPTPGSRQSAGAWGADSEFDNAFGQPMERLVAGASNVIPDLSDVAAPGYSPEYLASLSEEERQLLLQGLQENGMLAPDIQSQRSAAISAASRRRSQGASRAE